MFLCALLLSHENCLCESMKAFLPMAAVAEEIIRENGCADKITIVRKRSTEMTAEEDMDGRRANILGVYRHCRPVGAT